MTKNKKIREYLEKINPVGKLVVVQDFDYAINGWDGLEPDNGDRRFVLGKLKSWECFTIDETFDAEPPQNFYTDKSEFVRFEFESGPRIPLFGIICSEAHSPLIDFECKRELECVNPRTYETPLETKYFDTPSVCFRTEDIGDPIPFELILNDINSVREDDTNTFTYSDLRKAINWLVENAANI